MSVTCTHIEPYKPMCRHCGHVIPSNNIEWNGEMYVAVCKCLSIPTTPATARAVCSNQSITRKRKGIARVIASDAKNVFNNVCLATWVSTGSMLRGATNLTKTIGRAVGGTLVWYVKRPIILITDILALLPFVTIMGGLVTLGYYGLFTEFGRKSFRMQFVELNDRKTIEIINSIKAYVDSVINRSNEGI